MKKIVWFILLISSYAHSQVTNKPLHDPPVVINDYAAVISFDTCKNAVVVDIATNFRVGDTVLMIQMKGALIDTSNNSSFGTILDYKSVGNYEFNYINQKSGNQLTFKNRLTKTFEIPGGVVQLVRVPYYTSGFFNSGLTCKAWDGSKGGVLAVISTNGMTSEDHIEVVGKGFKGGEGYNAVLPSSNCFQNNFNYPSTSQLAGYKGESIANISQNINKGKASLAAGGGGGLSHNSGGGGGANAGAGGYGGYQADTCGSAPFDNRGLGGKSLLYTVSADKIFMGSGGGAGQADNSNPYPLTPSGGAGGGIVIIITDSLTMFNHSIFANGDEGPYCYSPDCSDGFGGGGGGGTVLLMLDKITDSTTVEISGGNGHNVIAPVSLGGRVGPGGGGGGGALFMKSASLPSNVGLISNGGLKGVIVLDGSNPWGATDGTAGRSFFNLSLPIDTVSFKPNIDSVRISDSTINCNSFGFKGQAFTNTYPIASWQWHFGDGSQAFTQNASHTYSTENAYIVKLIATDIHGCKDSMSTSVDPRIVFADAGPDKTFCSNNPVTVVLNGAGTGTYAWTPASYLNDSTLQYPTATISATTIFYLTITDSGCQGKDSVIINVDPVPVLDISKSNDINCYIPYTKLQVTGASQFLWSPAATLNSDVINDPVANPSVTTTYFVTGTNNNGCFANDSITVAVDFSVGNIVLPNSFSPNGDGINDCFGIRYHRDVQNLVFIIYNRYGVKVFETKNADECWDGYYKGQPADIGNYVYYLSATTLCGKIIKKGSILLIR